MSYITLFRKYVNPSNRWEDQFVNQSEKRLRWLKDEAFGNSKLHSTAYNVRHAHICKVSSIKREYDDRIEAVQSSNSMWNSEKTL